jgi:hypothetical protein
VKRCRCPNAGNCHLHGSRRRTCLRVVHAHCLRVIAEQHLKLQVEVTEQEIIARLNAELSLAQARNNEYQSLVQLYKALGGGWK